MDVPLRLPKEGDTIGGHFRLKSVIGRGSFGVVYEAEQLGLDRPVAVKMLLPHVVTNEAVVDRFKREARLASSLRSPHSVAIHGFGDHDGVPYLVMEFLRGMDLRSYLVQRKTVAVDESCAILQQALRSLSEAHDLGIIHRDLKPENLFLCAASGGGFLVKVLDFGIAKAIDGDWGQQTMVQLTREGMVCGTPEYMSPEQATGDPVLTPGVDIYSMGCIAYEMVAGRMPYSGNSPMDVALKHLTHPLPKLQGELHGTFIEALIRRAMAKDYADRFQTVQEFSAAIEQAINEHGLKTTIGVRTMAKSPMTSSVFERALDRAEVPSGTSEKALYHSRAGDEPADTADNAPSIGQRSALERPFLLLAIAAAAMLLGLMVVILVVATVAYKPALGETTDDGTAVVEEPDPDSPQPAAADEGNGKVVVEIESTPPGATVFDAAKKELCTTPCSMEVDPSTNLHKFTVSKDGYHSGTAIIDIQKTLYDAVALRKKAADTVDAKRPPRDKKGTRPVRNPQPRKTDTSSKKTGPDKLPVKATDKVPSKDKKEKKYEVPVWE